MHLYWVEFIQLCQQSVRKGLNCFLTFKGRVKWRNFKTLVSCWVSNLWKTTRVTKAISGDCFWNQRHRPQKFHLTMAPFQPCFENEGWRCKPKQNVQMRMNRTNCQVTKHLSVSISEMHVSNFLCSSKIGLSMFEWLSYVLMASPTKFSHAQTDIYLGVIFLSHELIVMIPELCVSSYQTVATAIVPDCYNLNCFWNFPKKEDTNNWNHKGFLNDPEWSGMMLEATNQMSTTGPFTWSILEVRQVEAPSQFCKTPFHNQQQRTEEFSHAQRPNA